MKAPEDTVKRYVGVEVEVERTGIVLAETCAIVGRHGKLGPASPPFGLSDPRIVGQRTPLGLPR